MAWRIHDSVVQGEIDNRENGVVRGRIWLHGLSEPVALELKGNAHPDLAGCLLRFDNPGKTIPLHHGGSMNPVQRGTIGDLTASRKVRVFDIPFEEAYGMIKRGEKPPEHTANSLYLEWFSEANGRVVVESADYHLEISPRAWRLTPQEEEQRAKDAAAGMTGFMKKLTEAVEAQRHHGPEDLENWDEFDYEQSLRESDAITDKYRELLEKYGDTPEAEELIAKEMGWDKEDEEEEENDDEAEGNAKDGQGRIDVDEINRICAEAEANPPRPDPMTEGVDWVRTGDDEIKHPLAHRALEGVIALMARLRELGLEDAEDDDLVMFVSEYQITGAKLAGALDSLGYDRDLHEGAFVVACLKRALDHLHKAQAGLEKVAAKPVLPNEALTWYRKELLEVRAEIIQLMNEFRGRK